MIKTTGKKWKGEMKKLEKPLALSCVQIPHSASIDYSGKSILSGLFSKEAPRLIITDEDVCSIRHEMLSSLAEPKGHDVSYYLFLLLASPRRDLDSLFLALLKGNGPFARYHDFMKTLTEKTDSPMRCFIGKSMTLNIMVDRLKTDIRNSYLESIRHDILSIMDYGIMASDFRPCCFNVCMEVLEQTYDDRDLQFFIMDELLSRPEYRDERFIVRMFFDLINSDPDNNNMIRRLEEFVDTDSELISLMASIDVSGSDPFKGILEWLDLDKKYVGTCLLDIYHRVMDGIEGDLKKGYYCWMRGVLNSFEDTRDQLSISIFY